MVMRFDPFREVDRLTQQLSGQTRIPAMPMDAYRRGEQFVMHFDVPGVDPGTIDLTVEKNVLTVRAERRAQDTATDEWLVAERHQGAFSRQVFLGEGLDADRIEARCENGVLTVLIPVAEKARARKVQVSGGGGQQVIDTGSTSA